VVFNKGEEVTVMKVREDQVDEVIILEAIEERDDMRVVAMKAEILHRGDLFPCC